MNKKGLSVEINLREDAKIGFVKLSEKSINDLKIRELKTPDNYLQEYMGNVSEYKKIKNEIEKLRKESLPKDLAVNCKWCNGVSTSFEDKSCNKYYLQMDLTYFLASNEFITFVERNKSIIKDKEVIRRLTGYFLKRLVYIEGRGVLWFDLNNFRKDILNIGLLSVLELLNQSETLKGLNDINITLEDLQKRKIENELNRNVQPFWYKRQIQFYEAQRESFKTKMLIEKETKPKSNVEYPTKLHIALFAYYVEKAGYKLYSELSYPSVKYWEKLAFDFGKHYKQIQLHYNKIYKTDNRIELDKEKFIRYVAEEMLNDYPKAKVLALAELKQIRLK